MDGISQKLVEQTLKASPQSPGIPGAMIGQSRPSVAPPLQSGPPQFGIGRLGAFGYGSQPTGANAYLQGGPFTAQDISGPSGILGSNAHIVPKRPTAGGGQIDPFQRMFLR